MRSSAAAGSFCGRLPSIVSAASTTARHASYLLCVGASNAKNACRTQVMCGIRKDVDQDGFGSDSFCLARGDDTQAASRRPAANIALCQYKRGSTA